MAVITVVSLLLLTLTGLDRLIPKFGLPREPEVRLKKKTNIKYDDKSCDEPMRASS